MLVTEGKNESDPTLLMVTKQQETQHMNSMDVIITIAYVKKLKNKSESQLALLQKRPSKTLERHKFIKNHVKNLVIMKECDFKDLMNQDPDLRDFAISRYPQFFRFRHYAASEKYNFK